MLALDASDLDLEGFLGTQIAVPGADYRLLRRLGAGGMSVVFEAIRKTPAGETPTVVKMFTPAFVLRSKGLALTALQKEAGALGKLNQRVPPTPFVVRYYESGVTEVAYVQSTLRLPWLALEYVSGGAFGTTLTERVAHAVRLSGHAFDLQRAFRAIDAICEGVIAVHEAGVVHRDLKPDNILCCGLGEDELFKITDFGIARWPEMAATFGGLSVGTPGYAPSEQLDANGKDVGPWTDVFALGALFFHVLTGEELFAAPSVFAVIAAMHRPERRSVRECPGVDPDLQATAGLADRIDEVIARATANRVGDRPRTVRELSTLLRGCVVEDGARPRWSFRRPTQSAPEGVESLPVERRWIVRHHPGGRRIVRHVAWNSDGTALAVTNEGLACWTGSAWETLRLPPTVDADALLFVHQTTPGHWLLGGAKGVLYRLSGDGVMPIAPRDPEATVERVSGDPDDVAVLVLSRDGAPPALQGVVAGRFLRAMPLEGVASVNGLSPHGDATWLVAGRTTAGRGFAATFAPLDFALTPIEVPACRSLLACAGAKGRGTGASVGTDGLVVHHLADGRTFAETLPSGAHATDVVVHPDRVAWVTSAGRIHERRLVDGGTWREIWRDVSWPAPLVSLHTTSGILRAMSADCGILEGRFRTDDETAEVE